MKAQVYLCECGYIFEEGLGKYGCSNCNGDAGAAVLEDVEVMECDHDKVYSEVVLTSHPSQLQWICRSCLEEGVERCGVNPSNPLETYDEAKQRKADGVEEKPKPE